MKNLQKLLWLVAIIGFVGGAYGLYDRLAHGHLDVSYGSYIPWGLWVGAYIYFIGVSAGAFLISTLVYAFGVKRLEKIGKLSLFTAVVALGVAMLSIWFDLGHPERALELILRTNIHSVMGWMIWFYSVYWLMLLVELWFALRPDFVAWSARKDVAGSLAHFLTFGRRDVSAKVLASDGRVLRVLGALGIPLAIALHGSVGALFGVVGARPYWNTGLTPIMFLVGALLSGGALTTFVVLIFGPDAGSQEHAETVVFLGQIVLGLLALDVILEWAEYSIGLYAAIPADAESMRLALFGPYAWVFWGIHVGLGVVIPAVILVVRRHSPTWVGIAGLLIAATFIAVRLNIVIPGLAVPELQGLEAAFSGPGLTFSYFPTLTEWLLEVWVVSTGLLAFLIGYRLLPIVTRETAGAGVAGE